MVDQSVSPGSLYMAPLGSSQTLHNIIHLDTKTSCREGWGLRPVVGLSGLTFPHWDYSFLLPEVFCYYCYCFTQFAPTTSFYRSGTVLGLGRD